MGASLAAMISAVRQIANTYFLQPTSLGLKAGRPSTTKGTATLSDMKTETVRLNVDIDRELHTQLKLRAVYSQTTVADLVRQILKYSKHQLSN